MHFALLGDDPDALPLVRAIADSDEHALTHATLLGELSSAVLAAVPQVRVLDDWSELLTAKLDAVIVGGIGEQIQEAAKRIASEGTPLIVFPRLEHGEALVYELSLIHDETGVRLFPLVPVLVRAEFRQFTVAIQHEFSPPAARHLEMERRVACRGDNPRLTTSVVEAALLTDLMLLTQAGGNYSHITAVHSGVVDDTMATATVTLAGEGLPDALWTLRPTSESSEWHLRASTDAGVIEIGDGPELHSIKPYVAAESMRRRLEFPPTDWADAFLMYELEFGFPQRPSWNDLVRAYEMLDAARRSVRRGRTIELQFEETSERSQFKTQMTAIGCGVLLLTLFAVIALLIIGAVFDQRTIVEKKADAAGAIIMPDEFAAGSDRLTAAGRAHVDRLAERLPHERFPVVVAMSDERDDLDRARRDRVVRRLQDAGIANAATQVELIELAGPSFAAVMRVARLLVFAPLFVYLAAQLLLFVTRPKAS